MTTQGERFVMRPSGTEPMIRFVIEMPDQRHAPSVMDDVMCSINQLTCHVQVPYLMNNYDKMDDANLLVQKART